MNKDAKLRDATVQEIQLELLRRTQYNALDGERIVASLLKHRKLWDAVLFDRPGIAEYTKPRRLFLGGLIKLRDLPDNLWNADKLFILTPTPKKARQLAEIAKSEDWAGEVRLYEDYKETDNALGTGGDEYGLLSIWWD